MRRSTAAGSWRSVENPGKHMAIESKKKNHKKRNNFWMILAVFLLISPLFAGDDGHGSRFSDEDIPLRPELVPQRPRPILELGEPFLGTGPLSPGFQLPTGAVWQPALLVFGTIRTAIQSVAFQQEFRDQSFTELSGRLDLFANLQLSGSERLVLGFRNLDQDGRFTGYLLDSSEDFEDKSSEELNAEIRTLFFEGDLGEIFPNLSPRDFRPTDIGFSIGRQNMFFQEGMLINDSIDGIGLTWNSLQPRKTSNFRTTFFYGWNNVNRDGISRDYGKLFALLTSVDFPATTMDLDLAYVTGDDTNNNFFSGGISFVQRVGLYNTSVRILASSVDSEPLGPGDFFDGTLPDDNGAMIFAELSKTPFRTHNHLYMNGFWVHKTFTPAARGPGNGGPLGRAGISFASTGIGNFDTAPLSSSAVDVAGAAVGYQMFFHGNRQQLIVEAAARVGLEDPVGDQHAATARFQTALGRRFVIVMDGFYAHYSGAGFAGEDAFGARLELMVRL